MRYYLNFLFIMGAKISIEWRFSLNYNAVIMLELIKIKVIVPCWAFSWRKKFFRISFIRTEFFFFLYHSQEKSPGLWAFLLATYWVGAFLSSHSTSCENRRQGELGGEAPGRGPAGERHPPRPGMTTKKPSSSVLRWDNPIRTLMFPIESSSR